MVYVLNDNKEAFIQNKKKFTILIATVSIVFILLSLLIDSNISAFFSFIFGVLGIGYINYDEFARKLDVRF